MSWYLQIYLKKEWRPLGESELTPDASTLLENLKPVMGQFLGQLGEGMRLFLFKAPKENGRNVITVSSKKYHALVVEFSFCHMETTICIHGSAKNLPGRQ